MLEDAHNKADSHGATPNRQCLWQARTATTSHKAQHIMSHADEDEGLSHRSESQVLRSIMCKFPEARRCCMRKPTVQAQRAKVEKAALLPHYAQAFQPPATKPKHRQGRGQGHQDQVQPISC